MAKIAIIGSGISGMTAAYLLSRQYDVKVFEKNDYIGGHTATIDVEYQGESESRLAPPNTMARLGSPCFNSLILSIHFIASVRICPNRAMSSKEL